MLKIMFICTGNICRSPLAHTVFEHLLQERDLEKMVSVESSGTSAWHGGERADSRMRSTAARHGIEITHRSMGLRPKHLAEYDLLLVMDHQNYRNTAALARSPEERQKIRMFRDYDPEGPGDVPDPWYGDLDGFEETWDIVERTCRALLDEIQRKLSDGPV